MRVREAVGEAAAWLRRANVASPGVDAELLVAFVLGVRRGQLPAAGNLTPEQLERLRALVRKRAARVPLQYLTGTAPFRHLDLAIGPGVFVPRPETETLIDWALRWLRANPAGIVVDLCSGSGAIAASVASEVPTDPLVYAVERDPAALPWLHRNVDPLGVAVVAGDAASPATLAELDGQVDLVLANPPYVPEVAAAGLPPEVSVHEPHSAVFAGADGLAVIRPLIGRAAALLRPGGAFAVEHAETHARVVPALVGADGHFTDVRLHHDLARRPRFTTATRAIARARVADLPS